MSDAVEALAPYDAGGPEEWPAALGSLGGVWACRTLPGAALRGGPLVFIKLAAPAGSAPRSDIATAYDAAGFRELVAKMQQIVDSFPPDERNPT